MPFHIFISTWMSSITGGLDFWRLFKDFVTVTLSIILISIVLIKRLQTKTYLWLVGLLVLYGFIHLILLLIYDRPQDIELLASAYNLRIFAYSIIGFSLALLLPKQNLAKKFSGVLILLSTIVCVLGFLQWLLPKDILVNFGYEISRGVKPAFFIDDKLDLPRVFSTLRDPNSLGAFLILPIVFLTHQVMKFWKTDKRYFFVGLLTLHVLILLLTFSRSALLATLLSVAVLIIFQKRAFVRKYTQKIGVVSIGVLVLFIGLFSLTNDNYLTQNLVLHADESTVLADPNELRIQLLERSVSEVVDKPLGHGPASAGLVSIRNPEGGLLTENYFLQILHEVGVFGFIVFVSILALLIKKLWDLRKNDLAVVLLGSFVGLVFVNLLFHAWSNEAVAISWFMPVGLFITNESNKKLLYNKSNKQKERGAIDV